MMMYFWNSLPYFSLHHPSYLKFLPSCGASADLCRSTLNSFPILTDMSTGSNPSLVLRGVKDLAFENSPEPQIRNVWDVIVRVGQTGICMSDVHYWQRGRIDDFVLTSPIVLGHESSGVVVDVGSAVTSLKKGDQVAIEPGVPCRHCDYCRCGSYNLCPGTVFAATPPHNGTLSKYYLTSADYCYKLPPHLSLEDGALCEPVAVAVQACKTGEMKLNQTVAVFGCGTIGLLCQAVAKASGAKKVVAIDVNKSRLEMAASTLGCADGIFAPPPMGDLAGTADRNVAEIEWNRTVADMIRNQFELDDGPDLVIEATGAQPCIQTGIQLVKKGGTYVQAGMGRENVNFPITIACIRELKILGTIRYTTGCYKTAVDLVSSGKVNPLKLITHRYDFEHAEEAFETVRKGGPAVLKVMISGVEDLNL